MSKILAVVVGIAAGGVGGPESYITSKSPPPEPCELDLTVPCETEAQRTAHADGPVR